MTTGKTLSAGNEIDSRCLKCKDVTNHTIVAMAEKKIAKVVCNVCGGRHNYRPPEAEKPAAKRKPAAKKGAAKATKTAMQFEEMMQGVDVASARPYAMTETFKTGDLLLHPTFGLGKVTGTAMPNRIEVLFKEFSKTLIAVL